MKKAKKILVSLCILLLVFSTINPIFAFGLPDQNANVAKAEPVLQILSTKTHKVYSQKENIIEFSVNNTSRFTANGVTVRPDISAEKSVQGVRILSTVLAPNNRNISPSSSQEYKLKMVVDESAQEGIYPITLDVKYKNNSGDEFNTSLLLYYEVRKDEAKLEEVQIIDDNFESVKPQADDSFKLSYKIENKEDYQIKNVKTRIEGLPEEFTLKTATNVIQLGDIMPLIAQPAEFEYYVRADVKAGSYPFKVIYEYDNQAGQRIVRQEQYNIFISPEGTGKSNGMIKYSGFSYPKSVNQDQDFQVSFQFTNNGERDIKDVVVKMSDNPVFLPKTPSIVKYDELKKGESKVFSVTAVGTGDGLKDRNYPINFEISYKTSNSMEAQPVIDTQVIGIYVNADEDSTDEKKDKNLPKIILDSYKIDPVIVEAGEEFDLDMVFRNTNRSKEIYNVKAYLTFDMASGKDTVNQNVFSPVNSSNTFYISKIGVNGTVNKKLRMYVVPDAGPKTYTVTVNFEYEDKDGKQIESKELVGIPVMQATKVESSELSMPTSVVQNQEISATFNIYNTGKAKAYNLMINAEGNFTADPNNQYIGNFEAGQSNTYEGYLRFSEPGEQKGKFVISYDDQNGKKYTIEKEFTIMVEEEMVGPMPGDEGMLPPDGMPDDMNQGSGIPWMWIIIGIIVLIIVVVVIRSILRKRKHKKEMNSYEEK